MTDPNAFFEAAINADVPMMGATMWAGPASVAAAPASEALVFGWAWTHEGNQALLKSPRHPYFFLPLEDEVALFSACCGRFLQEDIPGVQEQNLRDPEADRPWSCVECHTYFFHLKPGVEGRGFWAEIEAWLRALLEPLAANVLEVELEAYEVAGMLRAKAAEFGI